MARKKIIQHTDEPALLLEVPTTETLEPEFPAVKDELQLTLMRIEAKLDLLITMHEHATTKLDVLLVPKESTDAKEVTCYSICVDHT